MNEGVTWVEEVSLEIFPKTDWGLCGKNKVAED